ncbi:hypothetical protein B296_00008525 [Ensete ventricosum]|uniref:Uncharacterized protein n=1 Tax=Ensete ventricosum TaxID=4639 RepID=A0A427AKN2_ENSVE|nr:hypothetical protein B296_00008525 [Ensete ventricosum]
MVALGNGGYQPTVASFGADQFDEDDPKEAHSKDSFFLYFYLALNLGSLFSNTCLSYFEDRGMWAWGFWASTVSAFVALLIFVGATPTYRHRKPGGNTLSRFCQVVVAASRKWRVGMPPRADDLYEEDGKELQVAGGRRRIFHTEGFGYGGTVYLFSFDQEGDKPKGTDDGHPLLLFDCAVEEVKCVLRLLPIWLCTILYSVVFTQMASLFVRMGIGLIIAALAMVSAGVVEHFRLKLRCRRCTATSSLHIMWQVPQYVLIGASEVFMYVSQLQFFNGQTPDGLKSFGSALYMTSIAFGNFFSDFIITIVMKITGKGGRPGWIPANLNDGHLDRFYFLLAALSCADLVVYVVCAKSYKCIKMEGRCKKVTGGFHV